MSQQLNIGWIGLGVMGAPMCGHLLAAGYPVRVYTRSRDRAEPLIAAGAAWCESPAAVAEDSDVVFTMVGSDAEVRDVYFSGSGLLAGDISGRIFVDMGTTAPGTTEEIVQYCEQGGASCVDAPVSGGDVGARNATLSIMAGGPQLAVDTIAGLFGHLGNYRYIGPSASGQHCKMGNQIIVASTMIGVCEALIYASRAGLDAERLIESVSTGAAGCWTLDNLAPRIIREDYAPGFMVDHFIKDLGIAVAECERMGISLPGLSLARSLYERVAALGHGRSGTQALVLALGAGEPR